MEGRDGGRSVFSCLLCEEEGRKDGRCDISGQGQLDICNFLNMNYNFFASFTQTCWPRGASFSSVLLDRDSGYTGYRGKLEVKFFIIIFCLTLTL